MKWFAIAALIAAVLFLLRSRGAPELSGMSEATLDDLPEMVSLLASAQSEGSFFALGADSVPGLNVQLSYEEGAVGFDWVLLAPVNIKERKKAEAFAASRGQKLEERNQNNVAYLRTTTGNVAALCHAVLHELYGVDPSEKLWVAMGDLEWPP